MQVDIWHSKAVGGFLRLGENFLASPLENVATHYQKVLFGGWVQSTRNKISTCARLSQIAMENPNRQSSNFPSS